MFDDGKAAQLGRALDDGIIGQQEFCRRLRSHEWLTTLERVLWWSRDLLSPGRPLF